MVFADHDFALPNSVPEGAPEGVLGEGKSTGEELGKTHCLLRTLRFPQR